MDIGSYIEGLARVFGLVGNSSSASLLSIVGLLLLLLAGALAYVAVKTEPEKITTFIKVALFTSLVGGMLFSAAGPAWALLQITDNHVRVTSLDQAISNLENNARVNYVVRLISFDPLQEPELGIDRLVRLGPPKQLYSFVAAYDELVGHTVKDALEMVGNKYVVGNRVSAIIFPLRTPLFPANARGVLQVIKEVESRSDVDLQAKFLEGNGSLNEDELTDLGATTIPSYRLANFQGKYLHYCQLAKKFYCEKFPSRDLIGGLYADWNPLGFSQRNPPDDPCSIPVNTYCGFTDWKKTKADISKNFGSRAFLIRNVEIKNIPGRILIDFENPAQQIIPDIGFR